MIVIYCRNCFAATPSEGPTDAFHCAHCGHTASGTITADWIVSAIQLAEGIAKDGYLLYDIATALTCSEAEMFAEFVAEFGLKELAENFIREHATGDDEGDSHGIDEDGNLIRRD